MMLSGYIHPNTLTSSTAGKSSRKSRESDRYLFRGTLYKKSEVGHWYSVNVLVTSDKIVFTNTGAKQSKNTVRFSDIWFVGLKLSHEGQNNETTIDAASSPHLLSTNISKKSKQMQAQGHKKEDSARAKPQDLPSPEDDESEAFPDTVDEETTTKVAEGILASPDSSIVKPNYFPRRRKSAVFRSKDKVQNFLHSLTNELDWITVEECLKEWRSKQSSDASTADTKASLDADRKKRETDKPEESATDTGEGILKSKNIEVHDIAVGSELTNYHIDQPFTLIDKHGMVCGTYRSKAKYEVKLKLRKAILRGIQKTQGATNVTREGWNITVNAFDRCKEAGCQFARVTESGYCDQHRLQVTNTLSEPKKNWVLDCEFRCCQLCQTEFSSVTRRHHCRRCGMLVCSNCSKDRLQIPNLGANYHRTCRNCASILHLQQMPGESDGDALQYLNLDTPVLSPHSGRGKSTMNLRVGDQLTPKRLRSFSDDNRGKSGKLPPWTKELSKKPLDSKHLDQDSGDDEDENFEPFNLPQPLKNNVAKFVINMAFGRTRWVYFGGKSLFLRQYYSQISKYQNVVIPTWNGAGDGNMHHWTSCEQWREGKVLQASGSKQEVTRHITYTLLKSGFAPSSPATEEQRLILDKRNCCVVETFCTTPNVPSGKCFKVHMQFALKRIDRKNTEITITQQVDFHKSSWISAIIKNRAKAGIIQSLEKLKKQLEIMSKKSSGSFTKINQTKNDTMCEKIERVCGSKSNENATTSNDNSNTIDSGPDNKTNVEADNQNMAEKYRQLKRRVILAVAILLFVIIMIATYLLYTSLKGFIMNQNGQSNYDAEL